MDLIWLAPLAAAVGGVAATAAAVVALGRARSSVVGTFPALSAVRQAATEVGEAARTARAEAARVRFAAGLPTPSEPDGER